MAVVIEAVLRIGKKALKHGVLYAFAALAFGAIFFFIFAGAPFIEAMAGNQRLQAALTGVTAAVVGVVLNLAVWFGYKVILPVSGIDLFALISAVISLLLLQKFHLPIALYGAFGRCGRCDLATGGFINEQDVINCSALRALL